MSNQNFVTGYINTINGGIAKTFQYYIEGRFYEAVTGLVPILCYTIVQDQQTVNKLDELVEKIEHIPREAEKYRRGVTEAEKDYTYQAGVQTLSRHIYKDAVREIRDSIKADILERESTRVSLKDLRDSPEQELEL